ncbi:hypothetical protein BaRGS_00036484 [Batillaria attramentaria]|uniref:Chitinase n=1 Tax=Batillaria attramentaria TaxID=370345 RepID=A0ABD0JBS2_9CAEN
MIELKKDNPDLKVLLAVGGYNHGTDRFLAVAQSNTTIDMFASNSIHLLRHYGFDGLDISWQWPDPPTRSIFQTFVERMRHAFDNETVAQDLKRLILSVTVSADTILLDTVYQPDQISRLVDFVLLMTFDFFGTWARTLAHHSPLYVRRHDVTVSDTGPHSMLAAASQHNMGDAFNVGAPSGPYTHCPGILAYYEICEKVAEGWTSDFLVDSREPYAYSTSTLRWVCYDDPASFKTKALYVMSEELAGAMVWSLDLDDFSSHGCSDGRFPLISQLKNVFQSAEPSTPQTPSSTTATSATLSPTTPPPGADSTTAQHNDLCPEPFSFYQHPDDCSSFIICSFGKPAVFTCPGNLLFNPVTSNCDDPRNVQCSSG